MTETKKVKIVQKIAAYVEGRGSVLEEFTTIEEGLEKEKEYKEQGVSVGTVTMLYTGEDEHLDDAKGCYPSEEAALSHLKEIAFSHSSEPTDTEGHSYDCVHCGIHYYVYGGYEIPACTVEKVI